MTNREEKKLLVDIIESIHSIDEHLENRRILDEYLTNKTKRRAVEREIEIIRFISKEMTNKEIAEKLCLSIRTIDGHKERILLKTKAKNSIGIVMYAHRHNLL